MQNLSPKQKKFCDEYLLCFNATMAALHAGYSKHTARGQGSRLLGKPEIQEYLQAKKDKLAQKYEISQERVLSEYAKIAFFDIRKIFTVDGGLKPIREFDDESAGAIAGVESNDITLNEMIIGRLQKVKMWDKRAALDSICKMLGYNAPDKLKVVASITEEETVFE
jgi:phage terminase small subunit